METTPIGPQMRMYYRRKEAGLCVNCGKPLDIAGVKCSKCRDRANKDRRELISWYKENGICPICRKNNLFGNEKECIECSAKRYAKRMTCYNLNPEKFKEKDRIEQKKIREKRAANGLCVYCGKVKSDENFKTCTKCRNKQKIKKRIRDAKKNYKLDIKREWVMNGKCWFCGEPVYNHSKLCKEHYIKSLVYAKKSKEARIKNEQARTAKISAANDESSRK